MPSALIVERTVGAASDSAGKHAQPISTIPPAPIVETNHAISVGPARIEVGVLDSTHGWVKVRAELGGGGFVSTSLTVLSPAHDALHPSLPEIANYLRSEGVQVARIDLHRAVSAVASSGEAAAQTAGDSGGQRREDSPNSCDDHPLQAEQAQSRATTQCGDSSAGHASEGIARSRSFLDSAPLRSYGLQGGWVNLCA